MDNLSPEVQMKLLEHTIQNNLLKEDSSMDWIVFLPLALMLCVVCLFILGGER